jgi:putative aldouronate transport system substrate-binding protein
MDNGKGSLIYGSIQPEMKKTLKLYADMYKQGLIDPSFASIDGGKVGEQLTNGTVGVVMGAFWLPSWPLNSYYEKDGVEWDIYPLMKSTTFSGKLMEQTDAPKGKMLVVRKGFSNPEVVFKMLNYSVSKIYDPSRAETLKFHSNPKDPGHGYFSYDPIQFLAGPLMTNFNTNPNVTNAINKNDTSYLKSEHDKLQYPKTKAAIDKIKAGTRATADEWAVYKFFYGPDSTFGIQNKYFADNSYFLTKLVGYQSPEMIRSWQNLIKLEDESFTAIISGIKPISDFDKFVTQWKDLGGEVVQYEVNSWYKDKIKK